MRSGTAIGLLVVLLIFVACGGQQPNPSGSPASLRVVTTTTVLADLVTQVGGDRVQVVALVPKGGEVHTFDPAPSDAARLEAADLLVMNGLGLDDWLVTYAAGVGAGDLPVIELAEGLDEVTYIEGGEEHQEVGAEEEHALNPHLWMNVDYAAMYVDRIRLRLIELDAAGQAAYDANAAAYRERLSELDEWIRLQFESVPPENRRIVSFHDAFPYLAAAYRLEIVGIVVEAPGQEPSAGEVAQLIEAIRDTGARAILAEEQFNDDLARTIAEETDAALVSDLYTDSLGDAPLDSYEAIMRWDVERILEAIR